MHPSQLGPYELGKVLGKGGMGAVYEATDTLSNRRVAVKALNSMLAQAEGFRERFEGEIESLKTLRHDGIVRLYGYGEQDDVLYYAMELVEGTSLEEEIKAGRRFTWRETADIAIQICRALKHAHDHGVIHRDIKPANVLIDADNHVKLADFGIARLFGSTKLTTAGGVLGTADYMSPEQADGRPVTDKCDQYSLGGVMYALLTGRPPFRAKNLPEMLQLQRFARPDPVRRYARDTPAQLEDVITQLLSKDPEDRFPNTMVLARHLEAMVRAFSRTTGGSIVAEPKPSPPPTVGKQDNASLAATQEDVSGKIEEGLPEGAAQPPALPTASRSKTLEDAPTMAADGDRGNSPSIDLHVLDPDDTDSLADDSSRAVGRYTSVDDEALLHEKPDASPLALAAQGLAAIVSLVAIVLIARYLLQPPSADVLYSRIQQAAEVEHSDRAELRAAESDIQQFLVQFPDDPRAEQIHEYQDKIEIERIQTRLQRWTLLGVDEGVQPSAIEFLYLQAMSVARSDAERAASLLQSMLDLYGENSFPDGESDDSSPLPADAEYNGRLTRVAALELAGHKLAELREQLRMQAEEELPRLQARLDEARRIAGSDPERAAAIYEAILNLYGENAWATSITEEARRRLAHLQQSTASTE